MTEKSAGWPVNFDITGPICARARKLHSMRKLDPSGHHDWPVMSAYHSSARPFHSGEPKVRVTRLPAKWLAPGRLDNKQTRSRQLLAGATVRTFISPGEKQDVQDRSLRIYKTSVVREPSGRI